MACEHPRVLHVGGKTSDMCNITWPDDTESDGYVPSGLGIGGGDYLNLSICIDCKVVLGLASPEDIAKVMEAEAAEEAERQARMAEQRAQRAQKGW